MEPHSMGLTLPSQDLKPHSSDTKGGELFCQVTQNNVGKSMAIFVGGALATQANIREKICDGKAQISGGFGKDEAIAMAKELNA